MLLNSFVHFGLWSILLRYTSLFQKHFVAICANMPPEKMLPFAAQVVSLTLLWSNT